MGNISITAGPLLASEQPAISRGGRRRTVVYGTFSMSASYATNGDTIAVPNASSYGTLVAFFITPTVKGGYHLVWDGGTSTVKVIAYDLADGTAGNIGAQPTSTTDLSSITGVSFMAVYEK